MIIKEKYFWADPILSTAGRDPGWGRGAEDRKQTPFLRTLFNSTVLSNEQ